MALLEELCCILVINYIRCEDLLIGIPSKSVLIEKCRPSFKKMEIKGCLMSQIDITQLLEPQGPFDVIVHKLSDVMVEAERDSRSQQLLANFQVRAWPEFL